MKKFATLFALVGALFALSPAQAAPPTDFPASTISIYAGGAFMHQYSEDCYYDDYYGCSGYYHSSDTYGGPEFGADARIVLPSGFLIDLGAEHARVSDNGDAFLEQQLTAGLGYEGSIGRSGSWYVAGFYQFYRLGEDFYGCDYSCNGWYKANGGGVKGGFTWPFANRFFGTLGLRVSYLSGKDSDVDLVQAKLDGSVGYLVSSNLSVALGVSTQAIQETNDHRYSDDYYHHGYYYYGHQGDTLSHTAVFARLSFHF